jgi:hypothetical protein
MKKNIIATIILSIAIISCKKDTASPGGGTFTINGTNYKVTSTNRIVSSNVVCLTFTNLNPQTFDNRTVNFYFAGAPSGGTYNLVSTSAGMSAGQVYFLATSSNGLSSPTKYSSDGISGSIAISESGGKVTVTMASIKMAVTGGGTASISANVTEM